MNLVNAGIATALGSVGYSAYHLQAPNNTPLPYIVWNWQGGGQTADHDLVDGLEWVRAYGTTAAQAGSIYAAFDAILNGGTLTITGWNVVALRRESEFEFVTNLPNGNQVFTVGSYYRLMFDK